MRFQDDFLRHVFGYVGPENYIFISAVCRQWKRQYRLTHGPETITSAGALASSLATVLLYKQEDMAPTARGTLVLSKKLGENGDLQMVQWLFARNRSLDFSCLSAGAALGGHLNLLKWLRANGCDWYSTTCSEAAAGGKLEVLKWARANGCPWNSCTCSSAARGGHLEVLKWARANRCYWDVYTCTYAAEGGHLELLKWARANGCAWDEYTCAIAARRGHLEVLEWARANGCP